jgi:hypothetical protein
MPANECVPFYEPTAPAGRITVHCTAAVTGKRFLTVTGKQAGPAVSDSVTGGNLTGRISTAGEHASGVAAHDQESGKKVTMIGSPGVVLPVTAGATLAAGDAVQSDGTGRAIPLAAGAKLGTCEVGAATNADAQIKLV